MEKKIYKKPEMDVLSLNIKDSVLGNKSWGIDGKKEGDVKEGPEEAVWSLIHARTSPDGILNGNTGC